MFYCCVLLEKNLLLPLLLLTDYMAGAEWLVGWLGCRQAIHRNQLYFTINLALGKKFYAKFEAKCRNFLAMKWIWKGRFQNGVILSKRQFEYVPRCYSTSVLILQQNMTHDLNDCSQSYYATTKSHPTLGKYADRSNSFDRWIRVAAQHLLHSIYFYQTFIPSSGEFVKLNVLSLWNANEIIKPFRNGIVDVFGCYNLINSNQMLSPQRGVTS